MNTDAPRLSRFVFLLALVGLVVLGVAVGFMAIAELLGRWW